MKLNIKSEDIAHYKRLVARAASLVNKDTAAHNEQCIKFTAIEEGLIQLVALEGSSHKIICELEAEVLEAGSVYINHQSLSKMTQNLRTDVGPLEIFLDSSQLTYRFNLLGSIKEPIYTSEAFRGIQFPVTMSTALTNSEVLRTVLSSLPISKEFSTTLIRYSGDTLTVFSKYGTTGYIRFQIPLEGKPANPVDFYCKTSLLKAAAQFAEPLSLYYKEAPNSLRLEGGQSKLTLFANAPSTTGKEFVVVDKLLQGKESELSKGTTLVDYKGLTQALQWQSYKNTATDALSIELTEDEFCVKGVSSQEAACVQASGGVYFEPMSIHTGSFNNALKLAFVKGADMISFTQLVSGVKILILSPEIELPYDLQVLQYEQIVIK